MVIICTKLHSILSKQENVTDEYEERTLCHDGDRLSQVIIKPSNSINILTFELNVTFDLVGNGNHLFKTI